VALLAVIVAIGARNFANTPHKVPSGHEVMFTCCRAAAAEKATMKPLKG
jgi:hypothetical protein